MADDGFDVYFKAIERVLSDQDVRKEALEKHGQSVITSSGGLVTLLFGLVAFLTKSQTFVVPLEARGPLTVAIVAFVLAGTFGIATSVPLKYLNFQPQGLQHVVVNNWRDDQHDATRRLAVTYLKMYDHASGLNKWKARLVTGAVALEVVALGSVGVAVREFLVHGSNAQLG